MLRDSQMRVIVWCLGKAMASRVMEEEENPASESRRVKQKGGVQRWGINHVTGRRTVAAWVVRAPALFTAVSWVVPRFGVALELFQVLLLRNLRKKYRPHLKGRSRPAVPLAEGALAHASCQALLSHVWGLEGRSRFHRPALR